jgi:pyruvate dehydrogenase E2 component (dihydrolipoamide acetyltransferase)
MPTEFKLPEVGENIAYGDVARVLVSPGDTVAKDQSVLELETDKATIEVPSSVAGTVGEVRVKQGDRIKIGQVIFTVDEGGGAGAKKPEAKEKAEPAKAAKADKGDRGDKRKPQPSAPEEGGLSQRAQSAVPVDEPEPPAPDEQAAKGAAEQDKGRVDGPAAQVAQPAATAASPKKRGEVVEISRGARPQPAAQPPQAPAQGPAAPAAPSVRRLARELGVDIHGVPGSGPEGRISLEDVQEYVKAALAGGGAGRTAAAVPLPDFTKWGDVDRKPMSNIRRKTAEHLSNAWNTIPHVTQFDKADITGIEALRQQFGARAEKAGGKLTVTAVALKIVATALRKFPQFNSSIDVAQNVIVYKQSVHVGVAVDTERGLLVPVIRDVDQKGIIELAAELGTISEKARAGKLSLDEMQGGGFTITNLGGIGGTAFTPIINWPEVAILGMSRGSHEPVYNGQLFEPRMMLPLSLSYDHRVIDGADAARFLRWVAEAFEQPFVMAL